MNDLGEHLKKQQSYLKLGDGESFEGSYISWESIVTKFGKKAYRFILERTDGSRINWDTSNFRAVKQISDLIDQGLKKGSPIQITRKGLDKTNTEYKIDSLPF